MNCNLAILTDSSEFSLFKLCGDVFFVNDGIEGAKKFSSLVSNYKTIIVSETLAKDLSEQIKSFEDKIYPIILCLPTLKGNSGFAIKNLVKRAKEALGVDVFKES